MRSRQGAQGGEKGEVIYHFEAEIAPKQGRYFICMNTEHENESEHLEVLPPSATEAITRAEIDTQISTAKRYPRSLEAFKKRAISMAIIDEETAESCIYRRPVGMKDGKQQFAEGMSVRMAEIVGACYGNARVSAQLVEQTDRFVRARGMAIDLESNFASSSEVVESTVKKNGQPFDERMRVVVAKAALAKARRDATFQVVPRALAKPVEQAVRKLLMGDSPTIEKRRTAVLAWINKLGIDPKRVWKALGIGGESDLGVEQLEQLTGIKTAIRDNEVSIDEAFPMAMFDDSGTLEGAATGKDAKSAAAKEPLPNQVKPAKPSDDPSPVSAEKRKLVDQISDIALNLDWTETKLLMVVAANNWEDVSKIKNIAQLSVPTLTALLNYAKDAETLRNEEKKGGK